MSNVEHEDCGCTYEWTESGEGMELVEMCKDHKALFDAEEDLH